MLTRVLFALVLMCGLATAASAEDAKVLALGITDHEVTQEELEKGAALPVPRFNTAAIAYVLAARPQEGRHSRGGAVQRGQVAAPQHPDR